jgi:hypothetical protein
VSQLIPHTPPAQLGCPLGAPEQAAPQLPQFDGSVESETHAPPHSVCPIGHDSVQIPATQTWPVVH